MGLPLGRMAAVVGPRGRSRNWALGSPAEGGGLMRFEDRDPDEQIGIALRHQQLAMQTADEGLKASMARGDVEPHLRTVIERDVLRPRLEKLAERLCQTMPFVIGALRDAGLTVVFLDPAAREVSPRGDGK